MVLERSFATASVGLKKPCPKVTLGGCKTTQPSATTSEQSALTALPLGAFETAPSATVLQVARAPSKRGKEKGLDPDVEEIPPLKRQKGLNPRGLTLVLDALREGGEQLVNLLEKIRTVIPTREAIRDLETDQVGETIVQNVLWVRLADHSLFIQLEFHNHR